ncbi:MAG: DUF1150 family protein [Rhodobacteraceae bacterium]|nr:DUF1150 family protein [Paracoccaceae bacterium]
MQTPYPFVPDSKIAYIRRIDLSSLPQEIRAQVPKGAEVWGVHNPEGECIALTQDRSTAFFVARENDLEPVSAH